MRLPSLSRPVLALLSLLLVAIAPEPGERAGDPGDASAEITVARTLTHRSALHAAGFGVSGPAEIAEGPALPAAYLGADRIDATPSPWPRGGPHCCRPASRAPPAH